MWRHRKIELKLLLTWHNSAHFSSWLHLIVLLKKLAIIWLGGWDLHFFLILIC
jgi:hypothetical protein